VYFPYSDGNAGLNNISGTSGGGANIMTNYASIQNSGSSAAHNVMQPFAVVNKIIKL
jgi:microcystin-dependent protein